VYYPRQEFLACACFAFDQDCGTVAGQQSNEFEYGTHSPGVANNALP
jgi:hypothetical protein